MKLFFASDIHGSYAALEKVIARFNESKADQLIFLGDLLYHGPRNNLPENYDPKKVAALLNEYKHQIMTVRGNCDAEVDQMMLEFPCLADYTMLYVDGYKFFVTHGHLFDEQHLPPVNFDVFVHGHFHVPTCKKENGVVIFNPNSASLPKQGVESYGIYENHELMILDLNTGNLITKINLKDA